MIARLFALVAAVILPRRFLMSRTRRSWWRSYMWRRKYRRRKKVLMSARAKRRKKYLRLRQKVISQPRFRSVEEYAKDAQRDLVLLRFKGRNVPGARSALMNKGVLYRRYKRTLQFAGKTDAGWYTLFALAFLVGGVGMGIAGYLLTGHMDPTGARGFNPWFNGLAASGLGGGIGMAGLAGFYVRGMWTKSYDLVHVVEHAIESKPWLLTAIVRVYLPRLAFAAHDYGRVFSGGARHSGVLEGNVILELEPGEKADSLEHVRDVYKLKKKEGRYSGTSTRAIDGRVERVVNLSKRRAALKAPEKHAWLDKFGPYVVIAITMVVIFMQRQ